MKITIDTKEDSHEEIRKVIKMLQHLVGEPSYTNQPNIFEDSSPEATNAFVNMFGDTPTEDIVPNSSSKARTKPKEKRMDEEKTESEEEIPEVIPY